MNDVTLTNYEQVIKTGDSIVKEQTFDLTVAARWGDSPKVGDYESNLVWTLTPEFNREYMKWGTADYHFLDPNTILVEDGVLDVNTQLYNRDKIKNIIIGENVEFPDVANSIFAGLSNLERIENIEAIDTTKTVEMNRVFADLSMNTLDVSKFHVDNTPKLTGMFESSEIDNIIVDGWNVSATTDLADSFKKVTTKNLDLTSWDVSNVTQMSSIFYEFKGESVDMSTWQPSKLTHISAGFYSFDFNKTSTDLSVFNVSPLKSMYQVFQYSKGVGKANIENWDTASVGSFANTFKGAKNDSPLNLRNWSFNSANNIQWFFSGSDFDLGEIGVESFEFTTKIQNADGFIEETSYDKPLDLTNLKMDKVRTATKFAYNSNVPSINTSGWKFGAMGSDLGGIKATLKVGYSGTYEGIDTWSLID